MTMLQNWRANRTGVTRGAPTLFKAECLFFTIGLEFHRSCLSLYHAFMLWRLRRMKPKEKLPVAAVTASAASFAAKVGSASSKSCLAFVDCRVQELKAM